VGVDSNLRSPRRHVLAFASAGTGGRCPRYAVRLGSRIDPVRNHGRLGRGPWRYRVCAKNYQAGIFDENTGIELDRHRKPKANGAAVDVTTYVKLPEEAVRHTASELDMRDARHCDCNRAAPGSVGSAVPTPALDNR
jgi:hypothetical protein